MRFFPALLAMAALLFLTACERESAPLATPAPLSRPVVTLHSTVGVKISRALIAERNGLSGVFVLTADNVARFRLVRVGEQHTGKAEIISGLRGDETLVAGNLDELRDGSAISPNP